jgi:hypothetical protein
MPRRTVPIRIRLDSEDARALDRAQADGLAPADLVGRGLRIVAAPYYGPRRRRPPRGRLFVCTDPQLGDESQLFRHLRS